MWRLRQADVQLHQPVHGWGQGAVLRGHVVPGSAAKQVPVAAQ